jgi:hypothetical protein
LMLQSYNESHLKSSFQTFYGHSNDLVCHYKLSLAHMLNDLFHTLCWTVVSILALLTGNPVYLISTKDARRVWPVSRGCLLIHSTWSYLRLILLGVHVALHSTVHFVVWIMITFNLLFTSLLGTAGSSLPF